MNREPMTDAAREDFLALGAVLGWTPASEDTFLAEWSLAYAQHHATPGTTPPPVPKDPGLRKALVLRLARRRARMDGALRLLGVNPMGAVSFDAKKAIRGPVVAVLRDTFAEIAAADKTPPEEGKPTPKVLAEAAVHLLDALARGE